MQGDELLSVNGVDVKGKSAFEALSLIQGPSDTSVNIMVVILYKHMNLPKTDFVTKCLT